MRELMHSSASRLPLAWGGFTRNRKGTAAIEFALLATPLLTIFIGMAEYAHAVDNWRKLTSLARTVSDLTSQGDTDPKISKGLMDDILLSSSAVMRPFDASNVEIVVSALGADPAKYGLKPLVCSSVANAKATKRSPGTAADLAVPDGLRKAGARYVLTEASMDYRPMLGSTLVKLFGNENGTIRLSVSQPWPARGGQKYGSNTYTEIVLPGGTECR